MGAGRKNKPTALKKLEGTARKDRMLENEVAYPLIEGLPSAPPHLRGRAKQEWDKRVKSLSNMGILTEEDLTLLEGYCFNVGLQQTAMEHLNKQGIIEQQTNSQNHTYSAENKWVNVYNKAQDRIIKISSEFGFTPSSRTKISMPVRGKVDPLDAIG